MLVFVVFDLVLSFGVIVVLPRPYCSHQHNNLNEPIGWLLNKKAAMVEVNTSLAFLHWIRIALHP